MKIDDLERLTGQQRRNIRFLIAEGLVPEPHSRGRDATYGPEHLHALNVYAQSKSQGIKSLEVIKQRILAEPQKTALLRASASVPPPVRILDIGPGVELKIDPSVFRADEIEALIETIGQTLRRTAKEIGTDTERSAK